MKSSAIDRIANETKAAAVIFKTHLSVARAMGFRGARAVLAANAAVKSLTTCDFVKRLDVGTYFEDCPASDVFSRTELVRRFIAECCQPKKSAKLEAAVIYRAFWAWHEKNLPGQVPLSQKIFGSILVGLYVKEKNGTVIYKDITLNQAGKSYAKKAKP